ncbi:MAG: ureidoglycolate lyase [Thiolinea sp.]
MAIELYPEPLTAQAFAPFGDVIAAGGEFLSINFGRTERYHDLARLDTLAQDGHPGVSIFRSQPLALPATVKVMERHPLSSQAFISLQRRPFLVLVAPPTTTDRPDLAQLRLFRVSAEQVVNYHRGVWHHYSFSLDEPCDFLCIDRCGGQGPNCDEYYFTDQVIMHLA